MWFVYLLQHTTNKQIYIGFTSDLRKRLAQHNQNKTRSTMRKSGKWIAAYVEIYGDKKDALEREQKLKHHGSAKHSLMKRIKRNLL